MSRKTERIVNLTIALLATKRFITKSEIFRTVDGYEGSAESKERMFERDKDDLRNLGIEIEVGSFDPLFEDEAGYRIRPERYQFQLGSLTSQEISLLSLAAEAWRGAALDGSALTALRKLRAIGIESDIDSIPELAPHVNIQDKNIKTAIDAINSRRKITFQYLNEALQSQSRNIAPFAVISQYGFWYLYGEDLDKQAIRSFRLDRFASDIKETGRSGAFDIPTDFDLRAHIEPAHEPFNARLFLRSGRALSLRARALEIIEEGSLSGWDMVSLNFRDRERLIEEILWFGDDVVVASPRDLRAEIISRLEVGIQIYG